MTVVNTTTGEIVETLSDIEKRQLTHAEVTIKNGLESFIEVGEALALIQQSRLYREEFESFKAYCGERWNLSESRVYQLMDAASVTSTMVESAPRPSNERQARELVGLPPEVAAEVMVEATQTAPKVTATTIREARERLASVPPVPRPSPPVAPDNGPVTWRRTYMSEIHKSARLIVIPPEDVIRNADHALIGELFRAAEDINNYVERVRALLPTGLTVIKGDAK